MTDTSSPDPDGVVVVTFEVSDSTYPFVELSDEEDCRVALEKMLPRGSGRYAEFFSITGCDPDRVLEAARARDLVEPHIIARHETGAVFEFVVSGFCPARDLAKRGAIPRDVVGEDGKGRIVAEIPSEQDASQLIDGFLDDCPSARLVTKQTKDRPTPLFTAEELRRAVDERLTERQLEVLRTAYETGYYERASETTVEELANGFGIAPSTVSQHLRAAERKLVSILIEDSLS